MRLYFYADIEIINAIQEGHEMFVHAVKINDTQGFVMFSVCLKEYEVTKVVDAHNMYKVKRK